MKSQPTVRVDSKYGGTNWEIYGISLFGSSTSLLLKLVEKNLSLGKKNFWIATVNPEFVMAAEKEAKFKALLGKTSLNVVDGIGLIWAKEVMEGKSALKVGMEILGGGHRENLINGADLIDKMCAMAEKVVGEGLKPSRTNKVFFLGGWGDRADKTARYFKDRYLSLVVESSPGKPNESDEVVIDKINKFEPDFLFVAYGMKKQEEWIEAHFDKLKVGVVMGVGRSFDYYSGELPRAPGWMRRMGLEWLYSLYKEPKRWRRQLVLLKFIFRILRGI